MKINSTTPDAHPYLRILSAIPNAPKELFYRGELPEARVPSVAIIGTRRPTRYGVEVCHMLAYDLAKKGVTIISGLALGIDGIAHQAALEAGGNTIAVLANSVDQIYPRTNQTIGENILKNGGAILSEYEPPTAARDFQFLERNRIVSGLSDAVIIIEAAKRSGTLATATHALAQGRDVFVVPGNITSPLSAGCNALLKQGATPVTCAQDVLEVIAPQLLTTQTSLALGGSPLESSIISHLQAGIRDGDELCQLLNVAPAEFNQALTMLEIDGVLRPLGGNQWTLR